MRITSLTYGICMVLFSCIPFLGYTLEPVNCFTKKQILQGMKPKGILRPSGPRGSRGEKGRKGRSGKRGARGAKASRGSRGSSGHRGPTGHRGSTGHKGNTGSRGHRGHKGKRGKKGKTGRSARCIRGEIPIPTPTNTISIETGCGEGFEFVSTSIVADDYIEVDIEITITDSHIDDFPCVQLIEETGSTFFNNGPMVVSEETTAGTISIRYFVLFLPLTPPPEDLPLSIHFEACNCEQGVQETVNNLP